MNDKDGVRKWGTWLRAPARRSVGQDRSKFLRDERDVDWDVIPGHSNINQRFSGESGKQMVQTNLDGRNISSALSNKAINQGFNYSNKDETILVANFKNHTGPSEEELTGLNLEERNKRRRGPNDNMCMEIEVVNGRLISGTGLSHSECPVSSSSNLAKLARQASQPQ